MNDISSFFAFILSPVEMFLSEVWADLQGIFTYVLGFLMSFLQGLTNLISALVDLLNFGGY